MDATDTLLISGRAGDAEGDNRASSNGTDCDSQNENVASAHSSEEKIPSADDFSHAGEMLAAAREALALDIETISARTNVKAERLVAIEELNKAALPAPTFTLGFVRSYARTLNLPEDALVERFRRDAGYPEPRKAPVLEPKLQKDLGAPQQVSLFTILLITGAALWLIWQVLQNAAPDEALLAEGAGEGIPLIERAQSSTGATIQVTTSLRDEDSLGEGLALPSDMEPESGPPAVAAREEVVLDITTEELELALADGEEAARNASLARVRAAETQAGIETAEIEVPSPFAEEGEGDIEAVSEGEATEPATEEEPETVLSEADRLNAEALNRLALEASSAPEITTTEPEEIVSAEAEDLQPVLTEDGIAIVPQDEDAPAETVVAQPVVNGRVPATIRTAVEAVYPSRCESSAADSETVTVRYTVSRYGKVVSPEISQTTNPCFNRAAIAAVSRWDFFPAEEDGNVITDSGRTSRVVFQRP